MKTADKLLIRALKGEALKSPPIWLMRQAGRYLPEYRGTRAAAGSFLNLCYNPAMATEVTLQPIRRFGFDAAILFSDILVVADALGQKVGFEDGRGPVLEALKDGKDLARLGLARFHQHLGPVYETVSRLRAELPAETTLIGFAGAPWTVASYMIEGGSSRDFAKAKSWMYGRQQDFTALIALLVDATSQYLIQQVEAGAEVLQLFDSWAGALAHQRRWCAGQPGAVAKADHGATCAWRIRKCRSFCFPRGRGRRLCGFRPRCRRAFTGLSLDPGVSLEWALRPSSRCKRCLAGQPGPAAPGRRRAGLMRVRRRSASCARLGTRALSSSTSATASCPRRRRSMSAELVKLVREWRGVRSSHCSSSTPICHPGQAQRLTRDQSNACNAAGAAWFFSNLDHRVVPLARRARDDSGRGYERMRSMSRIAIVLFNLGGPDSLEAVRPFLFNLFSDPAIIRPAGDRCARMLACIDLHAGARKRRKEIYALMGGRSPILPNTEAQAQARWWRR